MRSNSPDFLPADRSPDDSMHFRMITCEGTCGLRFPTADLIDHVQVCPRCSGPVTITNHVDVRRPSHSEFDARQKRRNVGVLVDNVRSVFNIGSIFRCADGANVSHLFLCGISATPEHPKMAKTSLGAERSVSWSYHTNAATLATTLIEKGYVIWALDTRRDSSSLFDVDWPKDLSRLVLAVGNELTGLDPLVLSYCKRSIFIPMAGRKQSLNVAIALGIAVYWIRGRSPS